MWQAKWTLWVGIGAIYGALAVALGAFGAHMLKTRLSPQDMEIFQTANKYHMYHALALIGLGLFATRLDSPLLTTSGWMFTLGTLIFSGSLYFLVLTGPRILGAVTPVGGLLLIIGWVLWAWTALSV